MGAAPVVLLTGSMMTHNDSTATPEPVRAGLYRLARREHQVLAGLVDGRSYKQIAAGLGVSIDTVRTYVRSLYRKLRVHSATEAVARAVREGLIDVAAIAA
ncbi:MAG TPA: LuxR C-terminal-related transcriptional regulator [Kofleriaceae bacterium]|nr:LuxR C-terminal-related transcriptional regulator [Kofleriaceae bacterium]